MNIYIWKLECVRCYVPGWVMVFAETEEQARKRILDQPLNIQEYDNFGSNKWYSSREYPDLEGGEYVDIRKEIMGEDPIKIFSGDQVLVFEGAC